MSSLSHLNPQLQSMCMVRFQKSIAGAVGATLGNAPYKIAIAFVSPLQASLSYRVSVDVCIEVMRFFLE